MRILYIANARIPTERAHGFQIVKTIEAFVAAGHEVRLFLPNRRNPIGQDLFQYYDLKQRFSVVFVKNYLGFLQDINVRFYFVFQRLIFGIAAVWHVIKVKPDIIYSREITICFFLKLLGKKVALEDHEPRKSKRLFYRFFLKQLDKKIAVAQNLAKLYSKYGVDQKSFILAPNGVDLEEFKNVAAGKGVWQKEFGFGADDKIILYIGHFYAWKGVYTLIDSARHLPQNRKIVLIGGMTEDRKSVKEYLEQTNVSNVFIKSFVPHNEIIEYLKAADILVLPNTAQEERSEKYTTPIKLFEYMASGAPIIASDIPSISIYIRNNVNGVLFKPDDADDLAEKINYLLNNQGVAQNISRQAMADVQNYTWQKRAEKIINFIQ